MFLFPPVSHLQCTLLFSIHIPSALDPLHMEARQESVTVKELFPQWFHLLALVSSLVMSLHSFMKHFPFAASYFLILTSCSWLQQENWAPSHLSWFWLLLISPKISGRKTACKVMPLDSVLKCPCPAKQEQVRAPSWTVSLSGFSSISGTGSSRSTQCWSPALLLSGI